MRRSLLVSHSTKSGSASLSVLREEQGRSLRPEIALVSDIFSRCGRDAKPCSPARLDSHTSPDSYGIWRPTLCTESEAEPDFVECDT